MHNLKSGQALIMLVLMIALLMTIVAATSFRLTTEIQSSKLQEESVRALAAADAGIEVGLRIANTTGSSIVPITFAAANINVAGVDLARSQITITDTPADFVSQLIPKDEQLTYYLQEYPDYTSSYTGDITVLFGSEGGTQCGSNITPRTVPAIEISFIQGVSPNQVKREVLEPCPAGTSQIEGVGHAAVLSVSELVDGKTYNYSATLSGLGGYEVALMRTLFAGTRFIVRGRPLSTQGKLIRSEARSLSGPSKVVTIFQSLPQLPADFFVTTF